MLELPLNPAILFGEDLRGVTPDDFFLDTSVVRPWSQTELCLGRMGRAALTGLGMGRLFLKNRASDTITWH